MGNSTVVFHSGTEHGKHLLRSHAPLTQRDNGACAIALSKAFARDIAQEHVVALPRHRQRKSGLQHAVNVRTLK